MHSNFLKGVISRGEKLFSDLKWPYLWVGRIWPWPGGLCVWPLTLAISHLLASKIKGRVKWPQLACYLFVFRVTAMGAGGTEDPLKLSATVILVTLQSSGISLGILEARRAESGQRRRLLMAPRLARWNRHLWRVAVRVSKVFLLWKIGSVDEGWVLGVCNKSHDA